MSFATVDICFAVILVIFAIAACIKGFVGELFGKLSFILGILAAVIFNGKVEALLSDKITNEYLSKAVSFLIIFVVVFVVLKLIQVILQKLFSGEIMKGLDKALGLFLGIVEGIIIIAFVIYLMNVQPWFDVSGILEGSFFNSMLSGLIQSSVSTITNAA